MERDIYLGLTHKEAEWIKDAMRYEAIETEDFEMVRFFVHLYEKIVEQQEYEAEYERRQTEIARSTDEQRI